MIILSLFAALALIPQPREAVELGGVTTNAAIRYVEDASLPPEGYRLTVDDDGALIASGDLAGRIYAAATLRQLQVRGTNQWQCARIFDAPAFPWRGVHLDECRHFFGKEVVKRFIDEMVAHKFNRLHWHLTDDQGWRLDVPGYPELVRYAAVRPASLKRRDRELGADAPLAERLNGEQYGPFYYTEADLREVVEYARARAVTVVPEVEVPGHVYAALAAYPEFACFPENLTNRQVRLTWGVEPDVLCVGNDAALKFMEDVFDYVCRVFPGEVVHIGGDECPRQRWEQCPKCQARMRSEGIADVERLQGWASRHFVAFLASRGKRAIGWDEYLDETLPASAMGMVWRDGGPGYPDLAAAGEKALKGHELVMTPCAWCYLDYSQDLADDPYEYIGGPIPLERVYDFDPYRLVPAAAEARILGGQANNWSEYTWSLPELEWKLWPRGCAIAEVLWCGRAKPGFEDFRERLRVHRRRLIATGINCAPVE